MMMRRTSSQHYLASILFLRFSTTDLYLHVATEFPDFAGQIVFTVSLNTETLVDVLGRESEVQIVQ